VWSFADTKGEANADGIVFLDDVGNGLKFFHGIDHIIKWLYNYSTTDGVWQFPATDVQWNALAVSHDTTWNPGGEGELSTCDSNNRHCAGWYGLDTKCRVLYRKRVRLCGIPTIFTQDRQ
jgi:hypothetical protein